MDYIGLHLTKTSKEQLLKGTRVILSQKSSPGMGNAEVVYPLSVAHS